MTNHTYKHGERVTIYEDPLTELRLEGKAKLISFLAASDVDNTETWLVRFGDERDCYKRRIMKREVKQD